MTCLYQFINAQDHTSPCLCFDFIFPCQLSKLCGYQVAKYEVLTYLCFLECMPVFSQRLTNALLFFIDGCIESSNIRMNGFEIFHRCYTSRSSWICSSPALAVLVCTLFFLCLLSFVRSCF